MGEIDHQLFKYCAKRPQHGIIRSCDLRMSGGTRGEEQDGIASRRVAIDRNCIERPVDAAAHQGLQHDGRDFGICKNEGQHGRHVGGDHAGPLGDPTDGNFRVADHDLSKRALGKGIGRHDGGCRAGPVTGAQFFLQAAQRFPDTVVGQGLADHAGRCDENLRFWTAKQGCHLVHRALDRLFARQAGKRIGIPRIDDQRPGAARLCRPGTPVHRRRRCFRCREHACHLRTLVERYQQDVFSSLIAQPA